MIQCYNDGMKRVIISVSVQCVTDLTSSNYVWPLNDHPRLNDSLSKLLWTIIVTLGRQTHTNIENKITRTHKNVFNVFVYNINTFYIMYINVLVGVTIFPCTSHFKQFFEHLRKDYIFCYRTKYWYCAQCVSKYIILSKMVKNNKKIYKLLFIK